jgi:ATP-dependent DNA ligase
LADLAARLAPLRRDTSPFSAEIRERGVTWVEPQLVAQVGFSEWTRDGRLRHPRFLGLRDDKAAGDVVRESPR